MVQKKSAKTETKEKKKVFEDKTFGLKNKGKSKKVEKYIKNLEQTILKPAAVQKKEGQKNKEDPIAALFKTVEEVQKVPPGVDPKTVLCNSYKQGSCKKGDECIFSHDMALENKKAKINMYIDQRVERRLLSEDEASRRRTCALFLAAARQKQYGWFWICPNGGDDCQDLHALPEDYVLDEIDKPKEEAAMTLEEFIEREREQHSAEKGTPVTEETFKRWCETHPYNVKQQKKKHKASGKQLFLEKPLMFDDDDDAGLNVDYKARTWDFGDVQEESLFEEIEELNIEE